MTSKSLGGSAVFVDGYNDEDNEQKPLDPSAFGDNIEDDTSDVESIDTEENDTPPMATLTNEVDHNSLYLCSHVAALTFISFVGSNLG